MMKKDKKKKNNKNATLIKSHKKLSGINGMGDNHPPKNIKAASIDTKIIFAYSAKKKTAKAMPEYST